jgi:ABC-type nitrate/sulfonate/bicarbonate transport system permease component
LPAALPQIFVGLKGAAINATVGATIAEWIGGNAGLGYRILQAAQTFHYAEMYVYIIAVGLAGLGMNAVLLALQKMEN